MLLHDMWVHRYTLTPKRARARIDGQFRRQGRSAFEGLTNPASHWPGNDPPLEFDTAEIKGADHLPDRGRLRLDFNSTLTPQELEEIAKKLPGDRIDLVEDPCPYDSRAWRELRKPDRARRARAWKKLS